MAYQEVQVKKIFERALNAAQKVSMLIVDIGSNDFYNGQCPLMEATKLIDFALHLLRTTQILSIVFCSIFLRAPIKLQC